MPTHAPAARSPATRAGRGCRARRSARPERSPSLTTSATCNARPGEKSATPLPGPDLGLTGGGGGGEYAAENSLFVTPGSTLTIHDRPGGSGHATIVTGGGVPVIATAGGDAADPDQTFTVTGGTQEPARRTARTSTAEAAASRPPLAVAAAARAGQAQPTATARQAMSAVAPGPPAGGAGVLARASTATLSARRARSATARPAGHPRRGEQPGCGSGGRERRAADCRLDPGGHRERG